VDQIDKIVAFEQGKLDFDAMVELFQDLIDSGLAWQLQGSYGRMANALIANRYCEACNANAIENFQKAQLA